MARFSLQAIGVDRPGIVAAVTGVLADAGCNLEDSRMSILRGQFAIMLVVDGPEGLTIADLERAFVQVQRDLDLLVVLRPLPESSGLVDVGETVAIAVHGADRPGIVSAVAHAVADLGGNIVDLSTHRIEDAQLPGYVLMLSVALGESAGEQTVRARLDEVARELGVTCVVHPGGDELF